MPFMEFDRLAVFGDSLSDGGAIFDLTSEALFIPFPLASAGYEGVVSNGPVYSQTLGTLLDVETDIYAVASARAVGERLFFEVLGLDSPTPPFDPANPISLLINPLADPAIFVQDINLGAQVEAFVAAEQAAASDDVVVAAFNIGLNDLGSLDLSSPFVIFEAIALLNDIVDATLSAAEKAVVQGGADGLIFYGFPDAGFLPGAEALGDLAIGAVNLLGDWHLDALKAAAAAWEAAGIPATVIETAQITAEIDADQETFGFLAKGPVLLGNATDPELGPPEPGSPFPTLFFPENPAVAGLDADQVQFYDFLHPTTALHGILAAFSEASLQKETVFLNDVGNLRFLDGADHLVLAKGGNDLLTLGAGDDIALAGRGDDLVFGNSGDDIVSGGSGSDRLVGNRGQDLLAGGNGNDIMEGGGGGDLIVGGAGGDFAQGGRGWDTFVWKADGAADEIRGGEGFDRLFVLVDEIAGALDLEALGLSVFGIEEIVAITSLDQVTGGALDLLDEADLWGFL